MTTNPQHDTLCATYKPAIGACICAQLRERDTRIRADVKSEPCDCPNCWNQRGMGKKGYQDE